jgi:hypothetical protein
MCVYVSRLSPRHWEGDSTANGKTGTPSPNEPSFMTSPTTKLLFTHKYKNELLSRQCRVHPFLSVHEYSQE